MSELTKFRDIIAEASLSGQKGERKLLSPSKQALNIANKLEQIKSDMDNNMQEAKQLLRQLESLPGFRIIAQRAKSYWLPHIVMAISDEHDFLGSDTTIQDTIDEITELEE